MNQTEIFIGGEGDAWFYRNQRRLGEHDPVGDLIAERGIRPTRVLEVGCSNGWRLKRLKEKYGCAIAGIDPSRNAIWNAQGDLDVGEFKQGWADRLQFLDGIFDVVIYGFCLYITDPLDWFCIAAEGDRVLANGGYLVIHDFKDHGSPYARAYAHAPGALAYHVDFSQLWLAHPWYHLFARHVGDDEVVILQKRVAIPVRP